jgi:thymidylate synthase ThyX
MTIKAKVVTDSVSTDNIRLTTMELTYPRFIHAEFMTHRMFSRNASSSRAIPTSTMIDNIEKEGAEPIHWGKNQPGMQANAELEWDALVQTRTAWIAARDAAVKHARRMNDLGAHKQIVNRILEPFAHITVVVTATEYNNFFHLRCHKDAQPEIKELAEKMEEAMDSSEPFLRQHGEWHLPYTDDDDVEAAIKKAIADSDQIGAASLEFIDQRSTTLMCAISAARCARVSYLTHDKRRPSVDEDMKLYDRLMRSSPMHASPTEHQATPDRMVYYGSVSVKGWENPHFHGNFVGWQQFRKQHLGENVTTNGFKVREENKSNVVSLAGAR